MAGEKTKVVLAKIAGNAILQGWTLDRHGRLYNVADDGVRVRLRLSKQTVSLERKVPLSEEEREESRLTMKWVTAASMGLFSGDVEISDNKVTFNKKEEETTKSKITSKGEIGNSDGNKTSKGEIGNG